MKHIPLLTALLLAVSLINAIPAHALEYSIGAYAWYTEWERTNYGNTTSTNNMGPELMYGPLIGLKFTDAWSLSSVLLYNPSPFTVYTNKGKPIEWNRLDSDTTVNYVMTGYIKFFAGVKFEDISSGEGGNRGAGPGAGIGCTVPAWRGFSVQGTASGMYLWGMFHNQVNGSGNMKRYGYNLSASLLYSIEPLSLIVACGYRYQFYRTDLENTLDSVFSGATLSIIYSF